MDWNPEKIEKWLSPAPQLVSVRERWLRQGFQTLLDRGCGPGRHAVYFARAGFRVTGLDRSEKALAYLRSWAAEEKLPVTAVAGDIFSLPFPDGAFDCVLDFHASFHTDTEGYLRGVAELRRVLLPGGEVYLTVKSKADSRFRSAPPDAHADGFTLLHSDGAPHFYADQAELPGLFPGFTFLRPAVEVREPGKSSPEERIHYHLLLRREP